MKILKKFKGSISIVIIICLCVVNMFPIELLAETNDSNKNLIYEDYEYQIMDDGTIEIKSYNGAENEITVPGFIDGKKVTKISCIRYADLVPLVEKVVIPDTVTEIGDGAFRDCFFLKSVTIPSSVKRIGHYAFFNCFRMEKITIPDGVASIGESAFQKCEALKTVVIPDSVIEIGQSTFVECTGLESIELSNGLSEIGLAMFGYCTNLKNVKIPDSITKIRSSAFSSCISLKTIDMPNSINIIESQAFSGCTGLKDIIIPENVAQIGIGAFYGCESLSKIKIPNGVEKIEIGSFEKCFDLKNVVIPYSVHNIQKDAFKNCTSLKSVIIPDSVVYIDEYAFGYCSDLEKVTIENDDPIIQDTAFYGCDKLKIIRANDDESTLSLLSVIYKYGLNEKDILREVHSIEPSHGTFELRCSVKDENEVNEYQLFSGNKKIAVSKNGEFKDINPADFIENSTVYIKVCGNEKTLKTSLLLEVKEKNYLEKTKVNLGGKGVSFTLSDDVPLIGGSELNFAFPEVPVNAIVEDGTIKIGFNLKKNCLYSEDSYSGVTTTTKKKTMAKRVADWDHDMLKTRMISKDMKGYLEQANMEADIPGMSKKAEFTVFGYAEGAWTDGPMPNCVSGEVVVAIEGTCSGQKQFALLHIPMTVNIEITGKGKASGKVKYDFVNNELSGDVNLGASIAIEPYLGVGVGTWFSAGIYGTAEVGVDIAVIKGGTKSGVEGPGLDSVYLYGEAGLKAYVAKKTLAKIELISTKELKKTGLKDYVDSNNHLLLYSRKENSLLNKKSTLTTASAKVLSSNNYNDNLDDLFEWSEDNVQSYLDISNQADGSDLLISNIYGASSPQMASVGDKTVIAYIDEISSRNIANQTAAQYIVYDNKLNKYSDPLCIVDDNTADFNLKLYSDGKEIYAYYLDSNTEYSKSADPDIEEYASSFEVRVAKFDFDNNKFVDLGLFSKSGHYCYCPSLISTDDGFFLAWVENESDNVMGLTSNNSINYVAYRESVSNSPTCLLKDLSSITSLTVGRLNNDYTLSYCVDVDNDITTSNEELYVSDIEGNSSLVSEGVISSLSYTQLPGINNKVIACIKDGELSYIDDTANYLCTLADNNVIIENGSSFVVINDNIYYLHTSSENNNRNIAMIHYENGKYKSVDITDDEHYIDMFATDGNWIVYQSTAASFDDNSELETSSDLKLVKDMEKEDLVLDYANFDSANIQPDEELDVLIGVSNKGTKTLTQIQVDLLDFNTKENLNKQIINVQLLPGDSIEDTITIPIPESLDNAQYYLKVSNPKGNDYNNSDNQLELDLSYTDLEVDSSYYIDEYGDKSIKIILKNDSFVDSGATLTVSDQEENVVYSSNDYIEGQEVKEYYVPLSDDMIPTDGVDEVYKVNVVADKNEYYDYNNNSDVRVLNVSPVEIIVENNDANSANNIINNDNSTNNNLNNSVNKDDIFIENINSYEKITLSAITVTSVTPSTNEIVFKWDNDPNSTGFIIEYSVNPDLSGAQIGHWDKNSQGRYRVTDLAENTTYYYRVRSYKGDGDSREYSEWTQVSSVQTKAKTITTESKQNIKYSAPKIKLKSVKNNKKKSITVKWKWNVNADGYQILYSKKKNFSGAKKKNVGAYKDSIKIKGLSKGKTYYVRIRSFVKDNYGNKVYGKWSSKKKVKIKK